MTRSIVAAALLSALAPSVPATAQDARSRVLVLPFENVTQESRIVWLGEASAVLLADDLSSLGVDAINRDERREAFDRLQVPHTATLTDATVIRIGELVGASRVVVGTLRMNGDTLVVRARSIALDTGRIQNNVTEEGKLAELFTVYEDLAAQIASKAPFAPGERPHPPLAAFENYIKGLLAQTPSVAIDYLNTALKADSTFDRARLALWDVYTDQGEHGRALAAVTPVPARSDAWRRARFLSGLSYLQLERDDDAYDTFKQLADAQPSAPVLNNLGVIQLRRGGSSQTGVPVYFFNKATEADPTEGDYFFNLGYAYWSDHDANAAIYWLREAVRRNPADGDAHYVLGVALTASGATAEAGREKELARRLSSTYLDWEKRPSADAVPKGLERVKSGIELPRASQIGETLASGGQRNQVEAAKYYLDHARRLFQQEDDREALAEANRALFLSPYLAEAHLLVGRIHLRAGRTREAIDALKISLWSADTAAAHATLAAALAETNDATAATAEAQRALALDPQSVEARRVLDELRSR